MPAAGRADAGAAVVEATSSRLLWETIGGVYVALGLPRCAMRCSGRWC
jgi:hypothetical protein